MRVTLFYQGGRYRLMQGTKVLYEGTSYDEAKTVQARARQIKSNVAGCVRGTVRGNTTVAQALRLALVKAGG